MQTLYLYKKKKKKKKELSDILLIDIDLKVVTLCLFFLGVKLKFCAFAMIEVERNNKWVNHIDEFYIKDWTFSVMFNKHATGSAF